MCFLWFSMVFLHLSMYVENGVFLGFLCSGPDLAKPLDLPEAWAGHVLAEKKDSSGIYFHRFLPSFFASPLQVFYLK